MSEKLSTLSKNGDAEVEEVFPLVYRELRDRAERCLNSLPPGQSLAPTDLVHEAFIKLSKNGRTDWNSDEHFVAAAAMAMRQIAIDRIKRRCTVKRGGEFCRVELLEHASGAEKADDQLCLMVDELLDEFAEVHSRGARLLMMRFFLGMTEHDAAAVLQVSERTARRDWVFAKAWMSRAFQERGYGSLRQQ